VEFEQVCGNLKGMSETETANLNEKNANANAIKIAE
jgi:hypothetical protein